MCVCMCEFRDGHISSVPLVMPIIPFLQPFFDDIVHPFQIYDARRSPVLDLSRDNVPRVEPCLNRSKCVDLVDCDVQTRD